MNFLKRITDDVCVTTENILIMAEDPFPELTLEEAWSAVRNLECTQEIVEAYYVIANKFWWLAGEIDEREEGTEVFDRACTVAKAWEELWDYMGEQLALAAKAEGLMEQDEKYPQSLAAKEPIMEKYGYCCSYGWWIKTDD